MKTIDLQKPMKIPPDKALPSDVESYIAPLPPTKGSIIGLDCHPDTFTAAVFRGSTPHDAQHLRTREDISLECLLAWVAKEFSRKDLFLMEAGSNSFEICRHLQALGLRAVVLESAHVGRYAKKYADNDKMAAARIVRVYLSGDAPCVWIPDEITRERRELLHCYNRAVCAHTAASNALKGYLNGFTIRMNKSNLTSPTVREKIFKKREWSPLQRGLLKDHFAELDNHATRRKEFTRLICQQICAEPLMLRTMKLLGIGKINAFALLAVIGDIRRFEGPKKLVAYIGLNPGQRVSGHGKIIKVGIGRRGRGDLRRLLIQGAHAVLRSGRDSALGKWGWKLFARKGHRSIAVAAVARKLLMQVWHLLSGNPPVALEPDKSLATKFRSISVTLGKNMRAELGFPPKLDACVSYLHTKMGSGESQEHQVPRRSYVLRPQEPERI